MLVNRVDWSRAVLREDATIEDVIRNLEMTALRVTLIVDSAKKLVGIVTDGDIRRGFISGHGLGSRISMIMNRDSITVRQVVADSEVVVLMETHRIQHIPVVDDSNCLLGLHAFRTGSAPIPRANQVVIMAGGRGLRMRPLTEDRPKPMVEVGGKPILEHVLFRLKQQGFMKFTITINYLGESIKKYFEDGSKFDVAIDYIEELTPLGTAGALKHITNTNEMPFVVTNGDIISEINFSELVDFHSDQSAMATMAVRPFEMQNPFGVVKIDGISIVSVDEKPVYRSHISTGAYVFEPQIVELMPNSSAYQIPELFNYLHQQGHKTIAFHLQDPWMDIGTATDIERAEAIFFEETK